MKRILLFLFALALAVPFTPSANAQVVVKVGHHRRHHRHHHRHPHGR